MTFVFAAADNPFILIGVAAGILFAMAYGYYGRGGSDINQRPHDGRGRDTGAKGASSMSTTEDEVERTVGTRGTRSTHRTGRQ